jgi:glutamate N-acetyltransferase/amino-acid N-acetyltransferase
MELPLGFNFAAGYAGIRAKEQDDLALIVSGTPASAAAVFTRNQVQAAPVRLARAHLRQSRGKAGAILVNAGNANCATRTGAKVALACCQAAAKLLRLPVQQVLPASTGVIGVELDAKLITRKLPELHADLCSDLRKENFDRAARAIMTTDLVAKQAYAEVVLRRGTVRIAGMTKGSGMIQPRMATTLGFVVTDAGIPTPLLQGMLNRANALTYDCISVDGDTSTNDTLIVLANGASGVRPDPAEMALFELALTGVIETLAKAIARDGEGARKLITIEIAGASSSDAAQQIARWIANSPLVKTAIAGSDPNWGRIICAAGNAGVKFDPAKVDIDLQGVPVCRAGLAAEFDDAELKEKLDAPDCSIRFALQGRGKASARFWTCDLTERYIEINGSYRT